MKYLTYEQTYERMKSVIDGVTEELNSLKFLNDYNNEIDDRISELQEEINESLDESQIDEILEYIENETIKVDEELERWLEKFRYANGEEKNLGLDAEEITEYLNFIRDRDNKEEAIILLRELIEGPEQEQYRNLKNFVDFLNQELQDDYENAPETLEIKQIKLLCLINDSIIGIGATDIFHLDGNKKVDENQHALYLAFKSVSEDIAPEDFEPIYMEVMKNITNPYTKIGMNLEYLSKTEDYMLDNPNYKPNKSLVNEALPYLALKVAIDELGITATMTGASSNVFLEKSNIFGGMYFANYYIDETNLDRNLYNVLLKDTNGINKDYVRLLELLNNGSTRKTFDTITDDIFGDFIKGQLEKDIEGKVDEPLFIALILNSLDIDAENFRDNIDKIQKVASSNATLTKKDLIDISSLMFYIEETRDISQETRNMLREATLNWLNAYIDGTNMEELKSTVYSICEQAKQLEEAQELKELTDEEIENEMFSFSQDFYEEYVAAYVLHNLKEKVATQLYKYEQTLPGETIDRKKYLEALKYAYSSPERFDSVLPIFDEERQNWIKSMIKIDSENSRQIDCSYIIPLIFSMDDRNSIKQAVDILYRIVEEDGNHIYREASSLIGVLQKGISKLENKISRVDLSGRKLMLLNTIYTLIDDLEYVPDNQNSYFYTIARSDEDVKEHGKYYAFENLMESMSQKQLEKFYNQDYEGLTSPTVKVGFDMLYVYNLEDYAIRDESFLPDVSKLEEKLPVILAKSYMLNEMQAQAYRYGVFTSSFKDNSPETIDITVMINYLNNCEIQDDFYSVMANRLSNENVSEDTLGLLQGLGTLREGGKNDEFYRKYIPLFCGEFIENRRKGLLPKDPAEVEAPKQANSTENSFVNSYVAMLLNTSKYNEFDANRAQELKRLEPKFKKGNISSEDLFDLGSYLMFVEKNLIENKAIKINSLLSDLGENWMECYLDGGRVSDSMKNNLTTITNLLNKENSYEERE